MPAPSTQPQWDSNLTHTTALVAAHKTDGFGANEVPASDELNTWMNLVYVWIAWLYTNVAAIAALVWHWSFPVIVSTTTGPLKTTGTLDGTNTLYNLTVGQTVISVIRPVVGRQITAIGLVGVVSADTNAASISLVKSSGGLVVGISSFSFTTGSGEQTFTLGTPHTVLDGTAYYLQFSLGGTTSTATLAELGFRDQLVLS